MIEFCSHHQLQPLNPRRKTCKTKPFQSFVPGTSNVGWTQPHPVGTIQKWVSLMKDGGRMETKSLIPKSE